NSLLQNIDETTSRYLHQACGLTKSKKTDERGYK
ncbi:hypothetical protein AALP_AAs41267U000100, partial [Arabis alpina]